MLRITALLVRLATDLSQQVELIVARHRLDAARPLRQSGQATAEYALVLLGVAAIALVLAAWAAKSGKIAKLFDSVVDQLINKAR